MDSRLSETTKLGEEAQAFFNSDVGQYIIRRSEAESAAATQALILCDADDTKKIKDLQNRIAISSDAVRWLAEAIDDMRMEDHNAMLSDGEDVVWR